MVGEKLMKLRKKRGMSQQQVATALGVTRQTVSNWECDQGAPALDKASELARLYGVSLDDLVADDVEVVMADPIASRGSRAICTSSSTSKESAAASATERYSAN